MKRLLVIQHTSAGYLGLLEDHLEGRRIRFQYVRPFTERGRVPLGAGDFDGLILLGGGPWGSAGQRDVPTLAREIELVGDFLKRSRPVIGIELGAQILTLAAGGSVEATPLRFTVGAARRVEDSAFNGFLPETFPHVSYMRDRPILPEGAVTLAVDAGDRPAIFQLAHTAIGFTGHPGFKPAMAEDLIMEFEESAPDPVPALEQLRMQVRAIEDALVPTMTGLVQVTGLMRARQRIPLSLKPE